MMAELQPPPDPDPTPTAVERLELFAVFAFLAGIGSAVAGWPVIAIAFNALAIGLSVVACWVAVRSLR